MAHIMSNAPLPTIPSLGSDTTSMNSNGVSGAVPLERRCDNPDCTVYKMVLNVPKRKTPQFVTEPIVMEKPLLINGFTTIFQVEGQSAKLSDLKNSDAKKPLYRVVPNTHAHIVNYVVVDSDAESLRKINENDPATMRKLLDSQKQSADQMLKKLIAGHSVPLANINTVNNNATTSSMATTSTVSNVAPIAAGGITPTPVAKIIPQQPTPAIQLPTRVHPNLKITAVASADGISNIAPSSVNKLMNAPSSSNTLSTATSTTQQLPMQMQQPTPPILPPPMPLITPVPLANLQRAPVPTSVAMGTHTPVMPINNIGMSTMANTSNANTPVDIPVFDKMQQELQELRRTVALLAEAQAKNKQN